MHPAILDGRVLLYYEIDRDIIALLNKPLPDSGMRGLKPEGMMYKK